MLSLFHLRSKLNKLLIIMAVSGWQKQGHICFQDVYTFTCMKVKRLYQSHWLAIVYQDVKITSLNSNHGVFLIGPSLPDWQAYRLLTYRTKSPRPILLITTHSWKPQRQGSLGLTQHQDSQPFAQMYSSGCPPRPDLRSGSLCCFGNEVINVRCQYL